MKVVKENLLDMVRDWSPRRQAFLVGAAAGCVFGVFAAVGYYIIGQYRGDPLQTVYVAAIWGALVIGPMERRWGTRNVLWAHAIAAVVSLLLMPIFSGGFESMVERFRNYPFTELVWVTTLPLLSVGTGFVYTQMMRQVRQQAN